MNRRFTGGSIVYGINLLNQLANTDKISNYVIYLNKDCEDLPLKLTSNFQVRIIPFSNKHIIIRFFWEQFIFPFYILYDRLDILHSLGYVGPVVCPVQHIVSILDLNFKRHGNSMSFFKRVFLGLMVKIMTIVSKKIITISNFSKNDLCQYLGVSNSKIIVTHLSGSNDENSNCSKIDLFQNYGINSDYIIAFGSPSAHKNIKNLIVAFADLSLNFKSLKLLLVGHQHNNQELNQLIVKLKLQNKIIFTGFVPDDHIMPLLKGAKIFVFPSFYEGFGIPLLDAQAAGVPVIASNAASLPEVGGKDSAVYFDPFDVKDMQIKMCKVLADESLASKLVKYGLINRQNYSWKKTAEETSWIYQNC